MKRTTRVVVVGVMVVGAFAITGCSISIGSMGRGSEPTSAPRPAGTSPAVASPSAPVSPASPSVISPVSPSPTSAGATYLALVGPLNAETFALDTAVLESPDDLTTQSLAAVVTASAAALHTFNDHLRSTTWPRTALPDITTLAATNDVLVVVLQGYESDLKSPTPGADFGTVLEALQVDSSRYAIDRGLATDASARVRADLGVPPPSAPQVTLND
ncbi:MAG TPA: hypothetical protein VFG00_09215 [Acidothermaceae bacterium]|nr:hypothetical protein [Acidothermaceae bacterium]